MTVKSPARNRRDDLLQAAEALLREQGPHALSLRDIAQRSGTSTQAVYTEFGGKPGLADALYREGYRRLARQLSGVSRDLAPIERIRALCRAYRDTALANPHFYELMTGHPIPEFVPPAESRQIAAATFDVIIYAVERAMASGHLEAPSPRLVAEMLWTAGHGYLSLVLHGLRPDDEARAELIADIVLEYFASTAT